MFKRKMSLRQGVILCAGGIVVLGVGTLKQEYLPTRLGGMLLLTAGFVTVGKRLYESFQKRMKEKREIQKQEQMARQ